MATIFDDRQDWMMAMAANPNLARVYLQGSSDRESLNADDRTTYMFLFGFLTDINELAWKYYDKGIISEQDMEFYIWDYCQHFRFDPELVKDWVSKPQYIMPGFYDYVLNSCGFETDQ